jgi:DNA-binding GntR family transcriptional regulator
MRNPLQSEPSRQDVRGALAAVTLTRKDAVFAALQSQILELEIPPGTRLVEADLAIEFGVSKTPIREALLLLERSRLVELVPYSGAHVTWLSFTEYEQLSTILDSLEQPMLPTVIKRCTPLQFSEIEVLEQDLIRFREMGDGSNYRSSLVALHNAIFAIADNPHLSRILAEVGLLLRRYEVAFTHRYTDTWDLELEIVRSRVDALRTGDSKRGVRSVEAGHKAMREHFRDRLTDPAFATVMQQ